MFISRYLYCWVIFWYALVMCKGLLLGLVILNTQDMSEIGHIVHEYNSKTVKQKYTNRGKKMFTANSQKEVSTKLMKGMLDLIILQFLSTESMHGYQVITKIRKSFGVYFGPSTIYPLLGTLEKKGYVDSHWNMNSERPRKVYSITNEGQNVLNFTENSLNLICKKITTTSSETVQPKTCVISTNRSKRLTLETP
jgi:PadR family transcriptional regulator